MQLRRLAALSAWQLLARWCSMPLVQRVGREQPGSTTAVSSCDCSSM